MSDYQDTTQAADPAATPVDTGTGVSVPGEQSPAPSTRDDGDRADIESRAKAMGWVGKDDYRGSAENWRDADEFVKRGENELPILRERTREMTRKMEAMERQHAESIQRVERMNTMALQRQREQIASGYEVALRNAVEMGDAQRYDQLRRDYGQSITEFDRQVTETVQRPQHTAPQMAPADMSVRQSWEARNPWFSSDHELNLAAQHHHMRLQREQPGLSFEQNLAATERAVKQQYADRFGMARAQHPGVEGGGRLASSTGRGKGAGDLPADVRKVAERQVKEGLFKNVSEYATMYFEDA